MELTAKVLVTPHASEAYRARVCRLVTPERAEAEIVAALRSPLFHCPSANGNLTLWGCVNPAGYPFLVATDPADEGAPFLLVRTCGQWWYWHEADSHWRAYQTSKRGRIVVSR